MAKLTREEFEELELRTLDDLCERFTGMKKILLTDSNLATRMEISVVRSRRLIRRLAELGAIEETDNGTLDSGTVYRVSPSVCEIRDFRREESIARKAPADRVARVEHWARSHLVLSMIIVVILALTVVIALANQTIELIDKLFGK